MKRIRILLIIAGIFVLLAACSTDSEKLKIENASQYHFMFVQKNSGNIGGDPKMYNDEEKTAEIINEFQGLAVQKESSEKLFNQIKQADTSYFLDFDKSQKRFKSSLHPLFHVTMLKNGALIFTNQNEKQLKATYITTNKHPALVDKILDTLGES